MPIKKVNKKAIIRAAYEVFNRLGYYNTSMADIGKACGLLKGSIYHHFSSKQELMHEVLNSGHAYGRLGLLPIAYNDSIPPIKRLERFLNSMDEDELIEGGGCIMGNSALELSKLSPQANQLIEKFFSDWLEAFTYILIAKYSEPEARSLAQQSLVKIEGAIMLSRVFSDPAYFKDAKVSILRKLF